MLGYKDPLSPPIQGVQATLSTINAIEIHSYIQEFDLSTIASARNDGEPYLLLTILDLSQWTRIFECANIDIAKAMIRLQELHAILEDILAEDEVDLELAKKNTTVVEVALCEPPYWFTF